ncbi:acetate--CoA ligase family protein [Halobellus sp. GM3]|uniref:acetate--CoA ligase family protein n=1 Tax=Halobellus sp. GM3 TaxID=3458410 RepID=UPI00403D9BAE
MVATLERLFNPSSIALIGASESSPITEAILANLDDVDWDRGTYFVNPNRDEIFGSHCYDSVSDIHGEIDLAVIIVPASIVLQTFEDCCEGNVNSALILTAGFGELGADGEERERRLIELSEANDIPICGPNSVGIVSPHNQFASSIMSISNIRPGNIGIVTQSGGLLVQLLRSSFERDLAFSTIVDCGNQASISASEYIDHLLEQDETDVVACLIEGFKQPREFKRIAKKANDVGKPLLVLKLATSEEGQQSAQSHTGSLTSTNKVVQAVFEQTGVIGIDSLGQLIEHMELFSKTRSVSGNQIALLDNSGGGATLVADIVSETSLELAELSDKTVEMVSSCIPQIGSPTNPIDIAGKHQVEETRKDIGKILEALDKDSNADMVLVRLTQTRYVEDKSDFEWELFSTVNDANKQYETQFVGFTRPRFKILDEWSELISGMETPILNDYNPAIAAIESLSEYSRREPVSNTWVSTRPVKTIDRPRLNEYEAKQWLAEYDIRIPAEKVAESADEAVQHAESIRYPVCLKALSGRIQHKSDLGLVKLDLGNADAVRAAYEDIQESAPADIELDGVLVQEMVNGGHELIVGSRQTRFGQAITVGAGGVYTEYLDDTITRIGPLTETEVHNMIKDLYIYPVLEGVRGEDAVNIDSLASLVANFSTFASETKNLGEADLNPIIVSEEEALAVDALFILDEAQ